MPKGNNRYDLGASTIEEQYCHVDLPKLLEGAYALTADDSSVPSAFKKVAEFWTKDGKNYNPLDCPRDANLATLSEMCGIEPAKVSYRLKKLGIDGAGASQRAAKTMGYAIHALGKGIRGQTSWKEAAETYGISSSKGTLKGEANVWCSPLRLKAGPSRPSPEDLVSPAPQGERKAPGTLSQHAGRRLQFQDESGAPPPPPPAAPPLTDAQIQAEVQRQLAAALGPHAGAPKPGTPVDLAAVLAMKLLQDMEGGGGGGGAPTFESQKRKQQDKDAAALATEDLAAQTKRLRYFQDNDIVDSNGFFDGNKLDQASPGAVAFGPDHKVRAQLKRGNFAFAFSSIVTNTTRGAGGLVVEWQAGTASLTEAPLEGTRHKKIAYRLWKKVALQIKATLEIVIGKAQADAFQRHIDHVEHLHEAYRVSCPEGWRLYDQRVRTCYSVEIEGSAGKLWPNWFPHKKTFKEIFLHRPPANCDNCDSEYHEAQHCPLLLDDKDGAGAGGGGGGGGGSGGGSGGGGGKEICNDWNKKGICRFGPNCKYRHVCTKCGEKHPVTKCRK